MDLEKMPRIIDVSRHQGFINWRQVQGNIAAAMIKLGGSDDGFYLDGQAQRNVMEARSASVPIGMYVYLGGVYGVADESQHIINLVNQIGGLRENEPLAIDWEERKNLAGKDEVGYLVGIAKTLMSHGFAPPLIYMNLNYVLTQDWKPLVDLGCGLWVAAWGNNNDKPETTEVPGSDEWPFWAMWQFSSNTSVPGISGRVDHNIFNGTMDQFYKYGAGSKVSFPGSPTNISSVPTNVTNGMKEYIVAKNDTLSAIAGRYGKTWQELFAMNRDRIANPNKIYINQKLRVWEDQPEVPTITHEPEIHTHIVENGENLSVIAARYGLSSWRTLYDLNKDAIGDNPNFIRPGQILRLP